MDANAETVSEEFRKTFNVGRAVYWSKSLGRFMARSYAATFIAVEANEAFARFKEEQTAHAQVVNAS